jgi:hypothetical protein
MRAAMADYCGNGTSMTKDGTLIDIFDYSEHYEEGFVPQLDGFVFPDTNTATAFAYEAVYSTRGAEQIDRTRYAELGTNPAWSVWTACPDTFRDSSPGGESFANYIRYGAPPADGAEIYVQSVPACAHSEYTVGKWLHPECSTCTGRVGGYCTDPTDPRGWDQGCVDFAKAVASYSFDLCESSEERMAAHSECTAGAALGTYDSGCTLTVCMSNPSCCSPWGTWSAACVDAANTTCRGGREGGLNGFCGYFPGAGGGGGIGGIGGIGP